MIWAREALEGKFADRSNDRKTRIDLALMTSDKGTDKYQYPSSVTVRSRSQLTALAPRKLDQRLETLFRRARNFFCARADSRDGVGRESFVGIIDVSKELS